MSNHTLSSPIPLTIATIGVATFAAMDAVMKGLSIAMGAYNAMLWRTATFVAPLSRSTSLLLS